MYISRKCDFVKLKEALGGLSVSFIVRLNLTSKRLGFSKIFKPGGTKLKKINPFSPLKPALRFKISNFFIGVGVIF